MERSLNGKKKHIFKCEDHTEKRTNEYGKEKLVFVKGCGLTFKTCGNPQNCPKCGVSLPVAGA